MRGFAITLGLGVAFSLFTALYGTTYAYASAPAAVPEPATLALVAGGAQRAPRRALNRR